LRARTHFRRYRGHLVPLSCFALRVSFSVVTRASTPVIIFCSLGLIFGGMVGVGSCFHVLRSRCHFLRFRGRRLPFSFFALYDSFSAIPRATSPIFMFCAPELVFDGIEGAGSHFHVMCYECHFPQHQGRRVPFSCFALPDSFSTVPQASAPVFILCTH